MELALKSQTFVLTIVSNKNGEKHPIKVQTKFKRHDADHSNVTSHAFACTPTRCESDVDLERYQVSQEIGEFDVDGDEHRKLQCTDNDDKDIIPKIIKDDLDDLLINLRENLQEDTSDCINHVQHLMRPFGEGWQEKREIGQL